jgi:hypothetical protein
MKPDGSCQYVYTEQWCTLTDEYHNGISNKNK